MQTSIWCLHFFVYCTAYDQITEYRKNLDQNVYSCMEMSKQSYHEVMFMPIKKFYDYLKWKSDLEEEKQKLMEEETRS